MVRGYMALFQELISSLLDCRNLEVIPSCAFQYPVRSTLVVDTNTFPTLIYVRAGRLYTLRLGLLPTH